MERQQIAFIQLLRGIAPLLVMAAHLGGWWLAEANVAWEPYRLYFEHVVKPLNLFQEGGHLGVVLFFLVSGYIITHVSLSETGRAFAIRRFFRLIPLLALSLVLTALVHFVLSMWIGRGPLGSQSRAIGDIMLNISQLSWVLGTPYVLSVTWTLLVEIVFYVLTGYLIRSTLGRPFFATMIQICLVTLLVAPFLLGMPIGAIYLDAVIYLPILIVGRILYLVEAKRLTGGQGLALTAVAATLFFIFHFGRHGSQLWDFAQPPIYTYFYAVTLFIASRTFVRSVPILIGRVATISYSLYLLHLPVGSLILFGGQVLGVSPWLSYPICFATVFAAAELSYRWIEAPSQLWGRAIAARYS